jgi:hypothetical protein
MAKKLDKILRELINITCFLLAESNGGLRMRTVKNEI